MCKDIFIKHTGNIKFLLKALDGIYDVVYVINTQGTYLGHSVMDEHRTSKYRVPKNFVGKNLWDIFPNKEANMYYEFALDTMHKDILQEKYQTYSACGDVYEDLFYNEPLKNQDGKIIGVIGKVIDIKLLKNKVFNGSLRYLETITNKNTVIEKHFNDSFNRKFDEIIFLLKKFESSVYDNSNNDNLALIKQIKNLLKTLIYNDYNVKRNK